MMPDASATVAVATAAVAAAGAADTSRPRDTLVAAWITPGQPNRTYNHKLNKLVIRKPGSGGCAQAIEQAF